MCPFTNFLNVLFFAEVLDSLTGFLAINKNSKSLAALFSDIGKDTFFQCRSDQQSINRKFKSNVVVSTMTVSNCHQVFLKVFVQPTKLFVKIVLVAIWFATNISLEDILVDDENILEDDETIPEGNTDLSADNYVEITKHFKNIFNFLQGKEWASLATEICNKLTLPAERIGETINRQTFENSHAMP